MLYLDLETRSQENLIIHGLVRYAQHPTTGVICMSYAFSDQEVKTWFPEDGEPFPTEVSDHINGGGLLVAHNARFERLLFEYVLANDYGFKPPRLSQWRCSAAWALANGLPSALKDVCRALALPLQKMTEGRRLIQDYCNPQFLTQWKDGDKELMQSYCETDVETMRMFTQCLRPLTDKEWNEYAVTETINDRGVPVDVAFAREALEYANDVKDDVDGKIKKLTQGAVLSARARKARDIWLIPKLTESQKGLITRKEKITFDQKARAKLLAVQGLDAEAREFVLLVDSAGSSTISKYKTMVNQSVDGRVHGALLWNGAGQTGRYSSLGLQLHNMKRNTPKNASELIAEVLEGYVLDNPAAVLGSLVRAAITDPSGITFSDYAQIEARVLPWLTDCAGGRRALQTFISGKDLYTENALMMFRIARKEDVDEKTRQAAKCASLACQFGGGKGAFLAMAEIFGLTYNEDEAAEIVALWRSANQYMVQFWREVSKAAESAVRTPNIEYKAGRVSYYYNGAEWLWCKLPCGRIISYFQPRFEHHPLPWDEGAYQLTALWGAGKPKAGQPWPRRALSHLVLVENITQAAAASLMREALVSAENAGLPVILSVHDELVAVGACAVELEQVMEVVPEWAEGLPITAETKTNERYGK